MRSIALPDREIKTDTVFEDHFDKKSRNWLPEGGASVRVENSRIFMDAREDKDRQHPYLTLWCKQHFEGDSVIEYTARIEPTLDGSTNLNFIVYGSNPDGSSVLDTTKTRTGDYGEYHKLNNYIYTYLNNSPENDPQREMLRVRYRKDPGFILLLEDLLEPPVSKGVDINFVIVIEGPRMCFYADEKLIFNYTDNDSPHRQGYHAFRTWHSYMSADVFRVSRIV